MGRISETLSQFEGNMQHTFLVRRLRLSGSKEYSEQFGKEVFDFERRELGGYPPSILPIYVVFQYNNQHTRNGADDLSNIYVNNKIKCY